METETVGKPANVRRSLFQIVKEWFTGRTELIPFCYGHPSCPEVSVGDTMVTITDNESYDIIALSMRMDPATRPGTLRKWKVVSVYGPGDVCLEGQGGARTLTKYFKWDDGNRVRFKPHIMHTEVFLRIYKQVRVPKK
jgi:hypothetical protein